MFFELGIGETGLQPQALPAALDRARAHCAGAWRVTAGAPVPGAVVLLRWPDFAAREAAVDAAAHPLRAGLLGRHEVAIYGPNAAWQAARREHALPAKAIYELRVQRVLNGHAAEAARVMGESTLPLLQAMGAHVLGCFDLLLGARRPRIATFLAWRDFDSQQRAWARLDVEPRFWRRRDEEQMRLHRRLFGDEQSLLLAALPGWEPQANFGVPA